jgi:hypothetical protein
MPDKQIILQLVLMGDPTWLCLFKADFSDQNVVRGNLRVKVLIQHLDDIQIDQREPKRLHVTVRKEDKSAFCSLYFDTP